MLSPTNPICVTSSLEGARMIAWTCVYVYVYVYVYVCVRYCVCVYARACVCACERDYGHKHDQPDTIHRFEDLLWKEGRRSYGRKGDEGRE